MFYDDYRGYCGYLLEADHRRVLFGADTAYCDYFKGMGRVDLAIFGIGGYNPYLRAHASPEQAWEMANHLRADAILPMHHRTFQLSYEDPGEPMQRMIDAAGGSDRVVVSEVGGMWTA